MKKFCLILVLFQILINNSWAQEVTGDWHGLLEVEKWDKKLRITIHVDSTETGYSATLDSPDQEAIGIPIDTLIISDDKFSFELRYGNYKGLISRKLQTIYGVWKNSSSSITLNFSRQTIEPPEGSIVIFKNQYDKDEKYIVMRDDVSLFTSIYSPMDKTESYPILLVRTPYNSESSKDKYNWRLFYLTHLLKEKYIIVFQDVRGSYMSEGKFVDVRPFIPNKKKKETDENSDTFDTIDWLIKNVDNNNGNVGVFGVSYPGFYSTMALPNAHPALKAVSPQAPVTNWFLGDDDHHNGAFFLMDAFYFWSDFGRPRPEPTRISPTPFEFNNDDNYDFFKDIGPIKNVQRNYFGDTIQFWSDLMTHPNYDSFWKERNVLPHLTNIKPAVLVVGGWFDAEDLYGPLKTYEAIETQNKDNNQNRLVMGPWCHGQWSFGSGKNLGNIHFGSNTSTYFKDIELQFFNYYLKNKGEMKLPEASIFITGANEWKAFENWPPVDIEKKELYLDCSEKLSFLKPVTEDCYDEYVVDPNKPVPYTEDVHLYRTFEYMTDDQRFASRRPDVMVYQTEILEEDITVVGPLKVNLFVTTTGTDADYIVKMIDVFPDQSDDYPKNDKNVPMGGYQMLVRGEVMRGKFRNSFENPEPFVPNEITEVSFEIPDLAHQFKKGHRIMIQVQNSWFPLVDINPQNFVNIYEAEQKDFVKATHRIYHDAQRPSKISISILKN
jgi:putative CocE/NonD family hydrolase